MSKHTPGPWTTYEEADYAGLTIWIDGDFGDGQTGCICKLEEYSRSLMRANAALIAAAPDMLAALEDESHVSTAWMLDWVADRMVNVYGESENVDFVQSIRKRAALCRTALQKAKGTP